MLYKHNHTHFKMFSLSFNFSLYQDMKPIFKKHMYLCQRMIQRECVIWNRALHNLYLRLTTTDCVLRYGEVLPVEKDRGIAASEEHVRHGQHRCGCLSYWRDDAA